jgi:glycosyltransferase involved in cell wall biosynthesis
MNTSFPPVSALLHGNMNSGACAAPAPAPADVIPLFSSQRQPRSQPRPARQRLAMIGTFLPRKCGIATFTSDVVQQLATYHPEIAVDVHALDRAADGITYGSDVARVIASEARADYHRVAREINASGVDAVWIQHEYGIFGGRDGEMVCDFVDRLAAPLILTLHTILSAPSPRQRAVLDHLVNRASQIMVMSQHGRDLLVSLYNVPRERVTVIAHGAPDRPFGREERFKAELGLADRNVLMTFGLLGPGKGIERMIEALPAIVARHPDTVYRVVGQTHPGLGAERGAAYREGLRALAGRMGVAGHVIWDERFLDTPELLDQIEATDIYVTPYFNLQQSTSGTLSYAVALGKAVVSTPYVHARELLADGVGVLVEPDSHAALAEAIVRLLDDRALLAQVKQRAWDKGRTTIWPEFARASAMLVRRAVNPLMREVPITATPGLGAVYAMSDGTGMMQHSIGIVPDRRHGYCLDDNARALMLMNVAGATPGSEPAKWAVVYASFVQHAWNQDLGCFRNFMRFDRTWCEEAGSEDSNGRGLWALGHTVEHQPDPELRRWALRWFDEVVPLLDRVDSPRTVAFAMLGGAAVLRTLGSHDRASAVLARGGDLLHRLLATARRPDWTWFEAVLGYDNPRLPQALIEAGQILGREDWLEAGIETLAWINERQSTASGQFRPIGSETFSSEYGGTEYGSLPFDQQPLEAQAAIEEAL